MIKSWLNKIVDIRLLSRILSLTQQYKVIFYWCIILALLQAGLSVVSPTLVQVTIDRYISAHNGDMLTIMVGLMAGVLVIQAVLTYFFTFWSSFLGQSIVRTLRVKVFGHLMDSNLAFYDTTPLGTAVTRTISDIESINDVFSEGIINIISDLLTIVAIVVIMFYINWALALMCLITLPLIITATYIFKEGIKKTFNDVRTQVAALNTFVQEHVTGMSIIQTFNAEEQEERKFKAINAKHRDANVKSNFYYSIFFPVAELILAIATALLVWGGSRLILNRHATPGELVSFVMFLNLFFRPIRMLADKFNTLQMGMVAAERVFKIVDNHKQIQVNGNIELNKVKGDVIFDKVGFAYATGRTVLNHVSFDVPAGSSLAIVGATGAGKSSIISTLMRFYEIQAGEIMIDNKPLIDLDIYSLRRRVGLVLQDVFLFTGSINDNITLFDNSITPDQVREASIAIGAHNFINRLPGGYDFNVRERGAVLSLGQRQIISFLRALVRQPSILILDEATSSIDTESEMIIQKAIDVLMKNRTSIVIAHRLSTIQNCDNIIVLDKGNIIEQGNHAALLAQNGYYKKLYEAAGKTKRKGQSNDGVIPSLSGSFLSGLPYSGSGTALSHQIPPVKI